MHILNHFFQVGKGLSSRRQSVSYFDRNISGAAWIQSLRLHLNHGGGGGGEGVRLTRSMNCDERDDNRVKALC